MATATTRPNVLVIISHDTGSHLGCYGIDQVHSPNLDQLAKEGVRFTRFFATGAMCSPSRACMFSGLYPQRNGVMGLAHGPWWWQYHDPTCHVSYHFRKAGYKTVAAGVIHEVDFHENIEALGFDQYLSGTHCSEVLNNVCPKLRELAKENKPFYFQVGTNATHHPFLVDGATPYTDKGVYIPPQYVDNQAAQKEFAGLQGSVAHLDQTVGQILKTLDETGLADNTIVVYTVDHGIPYPRAKTTLYDPGIITALLVRWPGGGIPANQVCDHLESNVDMTPTLLELAGIPVPDGLDGKSFSNSCRNPKTPGGRSTIFSEHTHNGLSSDIRCLRTDRWKLIFNFSPSRKIKLPIVLGGKESTMTGKDGVLPFVELYDLASDPLEYTNLADVPEHQATLKQLSTELMAHLRRVQDPILAGPLSWPYYQQALTAAKSLAE